MTLDAVIEKSAHWINYSNPLVDEQDIEATERSRVVAALFHLSLEHCVSIHNLIVSKHHGSAFALLRPQFESYVRGAWFQKCASDECLQNFLNDEEPPSPRKMISEIEAEDDVFSSGLSELKEKIWGALCGFTHGGYVQVSWRITGNEITSDFDEEQIMMTLDISNWISYKTLLAISVLSQNEEMALDIVRRHKEIYGAGRLG